MEKQRLISKLNIRDYNNQLEKILTKKDFSEDVKNLLLSMLYKVETAYNDYSLINGDVKPKKEILEEILQIISEDCNKIEIVKNKKSECFPEEGKIETFLNARKILYELYQIQKNKFEIPNKYDAIKICLEQTLNQGYSISSSEIIRDFDGWSWNIVKDEIENLDNNLIFQTLKIFVGDEILTSWKKEGNKQDYIEIIKEKFKELYKAKLGNKLFNIICQVAILSVIRNNKEEKKRLQLLQKKVESDYKKINNKKEYLENLAKEKRKIVTKIKQIEIIIDDDKKLKNEFITRNEKLDINSRIFSLSDLVDILEQEKTDYLKRLNICLKKMEPLNYLQTKDEIENEITILNELKLRENSEKIYIVKQKEMLDLWLEAMKVKIENAEEKEKIIKLIYQIRYYSCIYVNEELQVKNIIDINKLQRLIITKACKQRIITIFSPNIKENYEIIKNILETNVIEFKNMFFKFIKEDSKIILEIYDEESIYKSIELKKTVELSVKLNKKIKVFI